MDKIYSRKRIVIPRIKTKKKSINTKLSKVITIVLIAMLTVYFLMNAISPIFENLCAKEASIEAINIITNSANNVLKKYNYQDIVSIIKSENSNILKTDVVVINNIATEITSQITNNLNELEKGNIRIPIGALTGSKFLTGTGPDIKIKIVPMGIVNSKIRTEFKEQGINQTMYRIFLEINCEIRILMPYKTIERKIQNQILLVETAIVGDVPETYYNLESLTKDETLRLID